MDARDHSSPRALVEPPDFGRFHRQTLPPLLASGRGALAARAIPESSIAFRLPDGSAYTYRASAGTVEVVPGDDGAATVIGVDLEDWQNLAREVEAPAGLIYAGRVRCLRGDSIDLMNWESALRALYSGRPPYDPAELDLRDRCGRPLEREATFALDADREDLAHFLRTAGYLFLRGVFRVDEVATFVEESVALEGEARKGDKLSWWGKNAAGEEALCRVTRANAKPRLATLPTDPRVLALRDLADGRLVHRKGEGEGVTVIYKRPGMTEGLGDLPWHRDCGMGGHALNCPTLAVSIYLTEATPETGELAMLPGSQHAAVNAHDASFDFAANAAHFHARPGDVSLHFSDTMHAAPPPTGQDRDRYRISAVLTFGRPEARHHRGEKSYNDVLHQRADGQIEDLVTAAKRV